MLHNANEYIYFHAGATRRQVFGDFGPDEGRPMQREPRNPRHSGNPTLRTPAPCELRSPIPPDQTKVPLK